MRNGIHYIKVLLLAVMAYITTLACHDSRIYHSFKNININGWEHNDTITFGIPCHETGDYEINITMRANRDFAYLNVSLATDYTVFPKKTGKKRVVSCTIMNKEGSMHGKEGISLNEVRYRLDEIHLNTKDSLVVKIHHCMRRESLPGIANIGIELVRKDKQQVN